MRKLPTILSGVFISITLTRVASFADEVMGAGKLGWVFAICLGAMVFLSSYHNKVTDERKKYKSEDQKKFETIKSKRARQTAFVCMVFSIFADGLFNLSEVLRSIQEGSGFLIYLSAVIYGLFPTFASALLGTLQGHIDKLSKRSSVSWISKIAAMIEKRIKGEPRKVKRLLVKIEQTKKQHETKLKENRKEYSAIEKQLNKTERELNDLRKLMNDDVIVMLNGATKKEKILAVNRMYPKLSQNGISQLVGCAVSQVNTTLKE